MPAGILTPPFPAPTIDPRRDPGWTFAFFVPGHPMPKGSPETRTLKQGGRRVTVVRDKTTVMAWVAKAAGIAMRDRMRLQAKGNKSFPFEAEVELSAVFTYLRP